MACGIGGGVSIHGQSRIRRDLRYAEESTDLSICCWVFHLVPFGNRMLLRDCFKSLVSCYSA